MHDSVLESFARFSTPLEGCVTSLYADVKGLLTVGIGCLVDPVGTALDLPWVLPDGGAPSRDEIARQWRVVKEDSARLSRLHWKFAAALTTMRLTQDGVLALAKQRLLANEKAMRSYLPNFDLYPADAQLACCSMGWAIGGGWPHIFGNLRAACIAQDWTSAIAACDIRSDNNPGIVPRNHANKLCFANAAAVVAQGLPIDQLYWPDNAPNASQRDQALRLEAQLAIADHVENYGSVAGRDVADQGSDTNPSTGAA